MQKIYYPETDILHKIQNSIVSSMNLNYSTIMENSIFFKFWY